MTDILDTAKVIVGASGSGKTVTADPQAARPVAPVSETALVGRKALTALTRIFPAALTETQWATLAGYAKTGGNWGTYKGKLRAAGLIEQTADGLWKATREGVAADGVTPGRLPPAGPDRAAFWGGKVPGVSRMVATLIKRWPHFTTRDALAADLGMVASGGTFGTYLGRLRANGLLEETGKRIRLSASVMGKAEI